MTDPIPVRRIRLDRIAPWRCSCPAAAKDYAKKLRAGQQLPPIKVQKFGRRYEIFDGMHRARAHKLVGRKTIRVIVIVEA
jgi:uncharacterized ParB-like nuclease family protein